MKTLIVSSILLVFLMINACTQQVETKVEKIGTKSITFQHDVYRESNRDILAKVKATRFALDLKKKELLNILDFFSTFM